MKTILLILLSFINLTFLLNVFNVNAGEIHTSEKAKQITNLKIGKFFLIMENFTILKTIQFQSIRILIL